MHIRIDDKESRIQWKHFDKEDMVYNLSEIFIINLSRHYNLLTCVIIDKILVAFRGNSIKVYAPCDSK